MAGRGGPREPDRGADLDTREDRDSAGRQWPLRRERVALPGDQ